MCVKEVMLVLATFAMACGGAAAPDPVNGPANLKAENACGAKDADACALLGMSKWLAAKVEDRDLKLSLGPFLSACALDSWFGCAMAASVRAGDGHDAHETAKKAYALAEVACQSDSGASACVFIGNWAAKANETEAAKKNYSRACGLTMITDTHEQVLGEYMCKRALEFGAVKADLVPIGSNSDALKMAKRTSGIVEIQPPESAATKMHRMKVAKAGAELLLCLSETGVPQSLFFTQQSEFPSWNQTIFETMRDWRYSPQISADGTPVPVCTSVTFLYLPSR